MLSKLFPVLPAGSECEYGYLRNIANIEERESAYEVVFWVDVAVEMEVGRESGLDGKEDGNSCREPKSEEGGEGPEVGGGFTMTGTMSMSISILPFWR